MVSDIATVVSFMSLVTLKIVDLVTLACQPDNNPHPDYHRRSHRNLPKIFTIQSNIRLVSPTQTPLVPSASESQYYIHRKSDQSKYLMMEIVQTNNVCIHCYF